MASERDSRKNLFKNVARHEDARRRRNESSVELRKVKKDEQLMKRRNVDMADEENCQFTSLESPETKVVGPLLSLADCLSVFGKGETNEILLAVKSVRRLLSRQKNPPIDSVLEAGVTKHLVAALKMREIPEVQFEAAWAITNIVSGTSEQTAFAVREGCVGPLVNLLSAGHEFVAEQAAWAIGNIAGDSAHMRDLVVNAGATGPLVAASKVTCPQGKLLETISWTLSNLCRHKNPLPPIAAVREILPALAQLICFENVAVVGDACWALSYLSDGPNDRIQMVIDAGVVPRLVALLSSGDIRLIAPALRTLGNVVTGDDKQTQVIIDSGMLTACLPALLKWPKTQVVKEACWALSNITAGNQQQIQSVMDSGCVPLVVELLANGDFKVQCEALWVVANIMSGGTDDQIKAVLDSGTLPQLCNLLTVKDSKTAILVLETIGAVLGFADKTGHIEEATLLVEEIGGLDKLEKLQESECENVYRYAVGLIEKYFDVEEAQVDGAAGDGAKKFEF